MKPALLRWLLLALLLLCGTQARAVTCTQVASTGIQETYFNRTALVVQGTFTVTCSRTAGEFLTFTAYQVGVNNGVNPQNQNNRVRLGNRRIQYELYRDSACTQPWTSSNQITDAMTWTGGSSGPQTKQYSYWLCIPSLNVAGAGGTYTDTVTMTLTYLGGNAITGTIPIQIYAPANCTFISSPTAITIDYVAFGPARTASRNFSVQCTSGMPYTLSTNVSEGVLVNLRYILSLSTSTATGTGNPQTHSVTVTVPAGQAGTCTAGTCTATQAHTITVSY